MGRSWHGMRFVLGAGALALLAVIPAVLSAVGVKSPWLLGGSTGLAALVVALGGTWQERHRRLAQRRDSHAFKIEDGCLVLANGRLPKVVDITDPALLGVHKAAPAGIGPDQRGVGPALGEYVPAYVPRDIDTELRKRLLAGGFVLLVGDSMAGKTRAAFEAANSLLADHLLIYPKNREAAAAAVTSAAAAKECVLWVDDLETYVGTGGLTTAHIGRLLTGNAHHRVILATIRAAEQARITADSSSGDDAARQAQRDIRQVIELAQPVRVPRMFSAAELERARSRDWDPRVAEALDHADSYGVAEYLAAGPALLRDWEDARHSSQGPHIRGAALVTAAVDIRRAGHTSAMHRALLEAAHEHYLAGPEHARVPREPLAEAWAWATRRRHATAALLNPVSNDRIDVLDYLVDAVQRRVAADDHVPEAVVRAAINAAGPADINSLAATAYTQGRYVLAEHAWRRAWQAQASNPGLGAEHPGALTSRGNLANVLRALGRLDEAEAHASAVADAYTRMLGAKDPQTLTSHDSLALVLRWLGRLDEAEAGHRAVLDARTEVLGPEHPDTLVSRDNLAIVHRDLGRLDEAEAGHSAVLDIRALTLGPEHPHTLASQDNLGFVLCATGRPADAETTHSTVLEARTRVLGPEHPHTLISRDNLAIDLRKLGRLTEAEAEHRAVLEARTRVLGPEHPHTLISRDNLAIVHREQGRLDEAEIGHRAVLEIRIRVLGPQHPRTKASRDNLALVQRTPRRPPRTP